MMAGCFGLSVQAGIRRVSTTELVKSPLQCSSENPTSDRKGGQSNTEVKRAG